MLRSEPANAANCSLVAATTTRHLRVLEDAGLLRQQKRGRTRVYTLDRDSLAIVGEWLSWFSK